MNFYNFFKYNLIEIFKFLMNMNNNFHNPNINPLILNDDYECINPMPIYNQY